MINAPDAIRHVLVTNHENYGRNNATKRVLQPVLGNGLLLAVGEAWRHQRRTSPRRSRRAPCPCSRATSYLRRRRRKPSSPALPEAAP